MAFLVALSGTLVVECAFCVAIICWQRGRIADLEQYAEDLLETLLEKRWRETGPSPHYHRDPEDPADWWKDLT